MNNECSCSCCSGNNDSNNSELKLHWDKTYNKEIEKLGWYEKFPEQSMQLIAKCNLTKDARMLHVGAGASTLIDELLQQGYCNLIANDISENALNKLQERLGSNAHKVSYVVDDIIRPTHLQEIEQVDLWHDRAVLHFFTNLHDQECYFNLVKKLVKKNGFVIIATFNLNGATHCSGLPVYRFNETMLQCSLGNDFRLIDSFNHTYTQPSGNTREFVYTLFQRN